ncbi:MAG: FAD-dependent thymidylate synthase [Candidatus Saccharimonadales bacterium]
MDWRTMFNSATKGTFVAIEGTDGSGKSTQFELVERRLREAGYEVASFDFPRYDEPSSFFVKQYLNGEYGDADEVNPYACSLFYALDRYETAKDIKSALNEGKIVLSNRFTGSNMAHQGTKFKHPEERRGYFIWLDNLEFRTLGIPRPDLSIVLRVPAEIAQSLVDLKSSRSYTDKKRDIHEANLSHMQLSVEVYDDMCQLFPKDFMRIDCTRGGKLLSVEAINKLLWEKITPLLPEATRLKQNTQLVAAIEPAEPQLQTDNPYIEKDKHTTRITKAGYDYLANTISNVDGNIYAFNDTLSPMTIAAAMARLSRRGDDMRVTILDEFAHNLGKDEKLLQRIITSYGDDSVQQLAGQHLVVEKASNLLTKKLEWGRLASYLEQSTRYIYFDQTDQAGKYKFHVPENFDEATKRSYVHRMQQIFGLYSSIVRSLNDYIQNVSITPQTERDAAWRSAVRAQACDAARSVLPVATESTVGIYASGQALESLIMHLMSDDLAEARQTGQGILDECRKVMPVFLERADKPDRGGASIAYQSNTHNNIKKLARKYLPNNYSERAEAVTLSSFWPHNELDIVADMLYEFSDQPLSAIRQEVDEWSYAKKIHVFETYMGERLNRRHRPARAIEKMHYSWDLICDYGIFRDLQRHRMVDDLEWQLLTPRFGYEVPDLIEQANLTDDFENCFDLSLELYSLLQKAGYTTEAQYATLLGHKMRWKVTFNAREAFHLFELRTSPQGHPGYRKLALQMYQILADVHPVLAAQMKFVNQAEDPELTRLAAERYTQFKLQTLK